MSTEGKAARYTMKSAPCNSSGRDGRHRSSSRRQLRREVLARFDEAILSEVILLVVELTVPPAVGKQILVAPALDDLALLEHQNLICAANGGQPVRDHERRAPLAQRSQAVLDQ